MKKIKISILFLLLAAGTVFSKVLPDSLKNENTITLDTKEGKIIGKIVCPPSKTPIPLVLIVAGSGPTDMNGNNYAGLKTDAYKMIAEFFRKEGIASVRYDKRGIGKSAGLLKSESDIRFDTYVEDVVSWVNLLKADKRFSKVIVLGHSEGSLLGMIACSRVNADGFISVAGAGFSADKILKEQLKTQPKFVIDASYPIIDSLVGGKTVEKVNPLLLNLFRPSIQPYMINWFQYDPPKEIAKLKIPVAIIQGTTDVQIKVADAEELHKGKPDAVYTVIPNMNHVLKECNGDQAVSTKTYADLSIPLKKEFTKAIKEFVKGK